MTLFFADLVREFSSSAGAGDFALAGAVPGHRRFAGTVPAGARFHYCIAGVTRADQWETGEGEIGSGGMLVRGPLASSAGGGLVAFAAGLKTVALTVGADWFAARDPAPAITDVTGLAAALADKQAAGDYAPAGHGHGIAEVTGISPFARSLLDDADAAAARATLGLDAAPPFLRAAMQHAVLGLGVAQAVPAAVFTTVAVLKEEDEAGAFSDAVHVYTVPEAGLYDCQLKVKAVDGAAPGASYGIGIDVANQDSASFVWGQLNTLRNGIQNRVVRSLAAGAPLRAFIYSDHAIDLNGAELVVRKVAP